MIDNITLWHKRARPEPTQNDFNVQLGCHIEEFIEMMDALGIEWDYNKHLRDAVNTLSDVADSLKSGEWVVHDVNRKELLDSLADQVVTAVGVAHCAKMDMVAACQEVNDSNWSKFNYKGFPEFDDNGKIKKGERYRKPNLEGMF
jgi:predicted HAD superfamily Cof-like phosphohydrolase